MSRRTTRSSQAAYLGWIATLVAGCSFVNVYDALPQSSTTSAGGGGMAGSGGSTSTSGGGAEVECVNVADCPPPAECSEAACVKGECLLGQAVDGAPCAEGTKVCLSGECARLIDGQPCSDEGECQSGHCADGVCCAGACDGRCEACDAAGTCQPHAAGSDPDKECSTSCDGQGRCYGDLLGSAVFGGAGNDRAAAVASRPLGGATRIALGGSSDAPLQIGMTSIANGAKDANTLVAALDAKLLPSWAAGQVAPDTGAHRVNAVATVDGRVYVAGEFEQTLKLSANHQLASNGGTDAFVAGYNAAGQLLWLVGFGGPGNDAALGLDVDVDDYQLAVVGRFEGTVSIPALTPWISKGQGDGFMLALDTVDGGPWYGFTVGGAGDDAATATATVDVGGSWYAWVTGYTTGSSDLGFGNSPAIGIVDGFLTYYDDDNTSQLYATRFGGVGAKTLPSGIAAAGTKPPTVAGAFGGTLNAGTKVTAVGMADVFLTAFSAQAQPVQSIAFGAPGNQQPSDWQHLALDPMGRLVLAGTKQGPLAVGPYTLDDGGGLDAYVAVLDATLKPIWARAYGDAANQRVGGVATTKTGTLLVAGSFAGSIVVDATDVKATGGGDDIFLLELAP